MDELDRQLSGQPIAPPSLTGARGKRCRVHSWLREGDVVSCERCGAVRDDARARRGKSSRRLGADQERRIERVYGPRKVGEFGDAVDHIGVLWKWQSKASRGAPPLWLAKISEPTFRLELPKDYVDALEHMAPISTNLQAVLIRSYVRAGVLPRDWLFVRAVDFYGVENTIVHGFVVIPGVWWLDHYGRDEARMEPIGTGESLTCPVHLVAEPCSTCEAMIAAGL